MCYVTLPMYTDQRNYAPHWQEKKKEFKEEIEIKSNDWIEQTWFPKKYQTKGILGSTVIATRKTF